MISRGSYVDFDGVHLYRYSEADGGYLAVLAHELTHAFIAPWFIEMEAWDWSTYRFFDEGFAEYVAQKVDSLKQGFPFYVYSEHIVAGNHGSLKNTTVSRVLKKLQRIIKTEHHGILFA